MRKKLDPSGSFRTGNILWFYDWEKKIQQQQQKNKTPLLKYFGLKILVTDLR